jgi:hypothetical protein
MTVFLVRARPASSERIADGITVRVFSVLNELVIHAVETGAECISDIVIETWKPAIEKEGHFRLTNRRIWNSATIASSAG